MNKLWIVVKDTSKNITWWKYFTKETDMDKFKAKIKWLNHLLIIEDSRDIIWR